MRKSLIFVACALVLLAAIAMVRLEESKKTFSPPPTPTPQGTSRPLPTAALATPSPAPSATPAQQSGLRMYRCPTCGQIVYYDPEAEGTRMITCPRCATLFFADSSIIPLSPDQVPSASATPTPTPGPPSADPLADTDAALQKMDWGQMAFDVPERLRLAQTALIHLMVSPNQTVEQLTATIREQATEPVKIEPARIQITDLMAAKLVGSAFDIQPITPEEPQMVSRMQPTEWKWEIRPRQAGRQSLHLTLNAIIRYNGEKSPRAVRTFDRIIEVEVADAPPSDERSGRWLLPAVGLAAFAALAGGVAFFLRRKRRPPPGAFAPPSGRNDGEGNDLFISYSRRDQEQALAFVGRLQAAGYKVWIDQRGIDGATLWAQEISEAIRRAKVCLLFTSPAAFASPNVAREVSLASEEGKPILPLPLEPADIPSTLRYQLAGIQHIALHRGEPEANFQLIVRALDRLGVSRPVPTDAG